MDRRSKHRHSGVGPMQYATAINTTASSKEQSCLRPLRSEQAVRQQPAMESRK